MIKTIVRKLLLILWPGYMKQGNPHGLKTVLKHFILQKILRIHSSVPWPVHPTSTVLSPENIVRGTRTPGLSKGCHIDGRNGIVLGPNVWIGPRVSLISMNHMVDDLSRYSDSEPIVIGADSWLATGSIVLSGVELGPKTIVAAGAVVTKSFPLGHVLLAGNPAIVKRHLD